MKRPGLHSHHSIRRALLSWLIPLFLCVGVASALIAYRSNADMVHEYMDEQMRQLGDSIAAQERPRPPPAPSLARARERGSFVAQVLDPRRQAGFGDGAPPSLLPRAPGFHDMVIGDESWRVYVAPQRAPGGAQVAVLQSNGFRQHLAAGRASATALPVLVLLVAAVLVLWLVAATISQEVQEIAGQAARQDENSITELPLEKVPLEIAPMVESFNSLLRRLREAFATQPRFVQDAAHELRTPVTAVALQLENLRRDMPPGACTESLRQLEAGVGRAQRLVDQLLKLTRHEADHPKPQVAMDLRAQVGESIAALIAVADQRRIDLGITDAPAAPSIRVRCVPDDLRSVLDNLIENALRYTPEGGVVDVRLSCEGGRAVVEVIDTGPGIPPAQLERVFDRFYRLPASAAPGSGLGLSIAARAAQRCGMRIVLRNREDRNGLIARVEQI